MKIDNAIVSSNNNPQYLEFWPFVAKAWRKIGIEPVLVFPHMRGEESMIERLSQYGGVFPIFNLSFWDIINQAQTSRLYAATKIKGVNIISDVDMLPISADYFHESVKEVQLDHLVSYTSDVIDKGFYVANPQYPMCYLAAHSSTFTEILGEHTWESFAMSFSRERAGYGSDQKVFYKRLLSWSGMEKRFIKLKRGWEEGRALNRLDKVKWEWTESQIEAGELYDCHMPRPYSANRHILDPLFNKLGIL